MRSFKVRSLLSTMALFRYYNIYRLLQLISWPTTVIGVMTFSKLYHLFLKSHLEFVHVDVFWGSVSVNRSSGTNSLADSFRPEQLRGKMYPRICSVNSVDCTHSEHCEIEFIVKQFLS